MMVTRRSSGVVRRRHALGLVELVLGAIGLHVPVNLGRREQENLVGRGRRRAGGTAALVVGHLLDRLHLGLEPAGQERPEVAAVEAAAKLRLLPTASIGAGCVHSLSAQDSVGYLERQARLAGTVGQIIVVDADDAVFERLAVRQLDGPFRPRIHSGLGLCVRRRRLVLRGDVLGNCLLLTEGPVLRVLGERRLDGRGTRAVSAAGTARFPSPTCCPVYQYSRHRVELVPDCRRDPRAGYHHNQDDNRDDQNVLDGSLASEAGIPRRHPPKGISAACMCGSSRIALADAAEDRRDY